MMKEKYEELRSAYLSICKGGSGEPCDGDSSVGSSPCRFYGYVRGCVLQGEEYGKELLTPCDLCRYDPPSSLDNKPCSSCPASAKTFPV